MLHGARDTATSATTTDHTDLLKPDAALHDAAIGKDGRGGEVGRAIAGEERDHAGDLLGLRHAPQRDGRVQRLRAWPDRSSCSRVDRRVDRARADPDHEDIVRRELEPAVRVSMRMPPLARQ